MMVPNGIQDKFWMQTKTLKNQNKLKPIGYAITVTIQTLMLKLVKFV